MQLTHVGEEGRGEERAHAKHITVCRFFAAYAIQTWNNYLHNMCAMDVPKRALLQHFILWNHFHFGHDQEKRIQNIWVYSLLSVCARLCASLQRRFGRCFHTNCKLFERTTTTTTTKRLPHILRCPLRPDIEGKSFVSIWPGGERAKMCALMIRYTYYCTLLKWCSACSFRTSMRNADIVFRDKCWGFVHIIA